MVYVWDGCAVCVWGCVCVSPCVPVCAFRAVENLPIEESPPPPSHRPAGLHVHPGHAEMRASSLRRCPQPGRVTRGMLDLHHLQLKHRPPPGAQALCPLSPAAFPASSAATRPARSTPPWAQHTPITHLLGAGWLPSLCSRRPAPPPALQSARHLDKATLPP